MKLSVSYLSSKFSKEETIKRINETSCDYLHVDLMDGVFAGTKNYEKEDTMKLLKLSHKPLDIHLMMESPMEAIKDLICFNPEFITIPLEISNVNECIEFLHDRKIKVGLAINPDTDVERLQPYLDKIDLVLVMSVYPGRGGQKFLESSVEKLDMLKKYQENNPFLISIDGGMNEQTISIVKEKVDQFVSGSFICHSDNYEEQVKKLFRSCSCNIDFN